MLVNGVSAPAASAWWPEAIPLQDITAQTIATIFVCEWVSQYGVLERLTSDRGRQFVEIADIAIETHPTIRFSL